MACFIVPGAEAVVTTVVKKVIDSKEVHDNNKETESIERKSFSKKLGWLNNMLIGGSALLAFEHFWHGEIVPYFPFLSAMNDPSDAAEMLSEMSTVGVSMALLITLVWGGMVLVSNAIEKKNEVEAETK